MNHDGNEGGWAEEDHREFGVLLRVFSPDDGDRYKKALTLHAMWFRSPRTVCHLTVTHPSRMRYIGGEEEVYFEKQLDSA